MEGGGFPDEAQLLGPVPPDEALPELVGPEAVFRPRTAGVFPRLRRRLQAQEVFHLLNCAGRGREQLVGQCLTARRGSSGEAPGLGEPHLAELPHDSLDESRRVAGLFRQQSQVLLAGHGLHPLPAPEGLF